MTLVLWTLEARTRIEAIESYIAQENPVVAKETVAAILSRTRQLEIAPLSGRQVPDYREDDLRELLERPYRIIYRVKHDAVEVLTVCTTANVYPLNRRISTNAARESPFFNHLPSSAARAADTVTLCPTASPASG